MRKERQRCSPANPNNPQSSLPVRWESLEARLFMDALPINPALGVPFDRIVANPSPGNLLYEKTLADINGDGKLDAVVGFFGEGVKWFAFPPSGRVTDIWPPFTIDESGDSYEAMKAFDINRDGAVDVIASISNRVVWYENPRGHGGDPGFDIWQKHDIGQGPVHEIELADFDGDGKTDVATNLRIFFQNDPDDWTTVGAPVYTRISKGLALFNSGSGFGSISLVGTNPRPPYRIAWFENPREHGGNPRTDSWRRYNIGLSFSNTEPDLGVAFATFDVNGDGRQDVVAAQSEQGNLSHRPTHGLIWFAAPANRKQANWPGRTIDHTFEDVHQLSVADVNNDGRKEIVLTETEQSDQDRVAILFNTRGTGKLWQAEILSHESGHNQDVGDIDGDGDIDIFSSPHGFLGHETPLEVYLNQSKRKR
jgi:hypothetical protein